MNKQYLLDILKKAGMAAIYGLLASIVATQNLNGEAFEIAALVAVARALIIFFSTFKDELEPTTAGKQIFKRTGWKQHF